MLQFGQRIAPNFSRHVVVIYLGPVKVACADRTLAVLGSDHLSQLLRENPVLLVTHQSVPGPFAI